MSDDNYHYKDCQCVDCLGNISEYYKKYYRGYIHDPSKCIGGTCTFDLGCDSRMARLDDTSNICFECRVKNCKKHKGVPVGSKFQMPKYNDIKGWQIAKSIYEKWPYVFEGRYYDTYRDENGDLRIRYFYCHGLRYTTPKTNYELYEFKKEFEIHP